MKIVAAVLVSSIVMAGGAWAADTHISAGPTVAQFYALKTQVTVLQSKYNTLTQAIGALIIFDKQCLNNWKAVKEYSGYNTVFSDNSTGTTTALDWPVTGDTPDGFLALAKSDCSNQVP